MSKHAHTPGPWHIEIKSPMTVYKEACYAIYGKDGLLPIVTIPITGHETDADADLIAAAPELLEALEEVLDTDSHSGWGEVHHKALQLIKKIKGES